MLINSMVKLGLVIVLSCSFSSYGIAAAWADSTRSDARSATYQDCEWRENALAAFASAEAELNVLRGRGVDVDSIIAGRRLSAEALGELAVEIRAIKNKTLLRVVGTMNPTMKKISSGGRDQIIAVLTDLGVATSDTNSITLISKLIEAAQIRDSQSFHRLLQELLPKEESDADDDDNDAAAAWHAQYKRQQEADRPILIAKLKKIVDASLSFSGNTGNVLTDVAAVLPMLSRCTTLEMRFVLSQNLINKSKTISDDVAKSLIAVARKGDPLAFYKELLREI